MEREKFKLAQELEKFIVQKEEQETRLLELLRHENVIEVLMHEIQRPNSAIEESDIVEINAAIKREIQTRIGLIRESLKVLNKQFAEI